MKENDLQLQVSVDVSDVDAYLAPIRKAHEMAAHFQAERDAAVAQSLKAEGELKKFTDDRALLAQDLAEARAELTSRAQSEQALRDQLEQTKWKLLAADANAADDLRTARAERDLHRAALEKATEDRDYNRAGFSSAMKERNRLANDALAALAGTGTATPEKGYLVEPHCLSGDIAKLGRDRDEWKSKYEKAQAALIKINAIRDSIIGGQCFNWSEHAYPLVAALDAAAIEGMGYPAARENFGTMLEQRDKALAECDALDAKLTAVQNALEKAHAFKAYVHKRLDDAGVPADPSPEMNAKTGCRIGGRLDWLIHGRDAQRKMNEATHAAFHEVSRSMHSPTDEGAQMLRKVADERDRLKDLLKRSLPSVQFANLLHLADEIILAMRGVQPFEAAKPTESPLRGCAMPGCKNTEHPRGGGYCDQHPFEELRENNARLAKRPICGSVEHTRHEPGHQ